MGSEDTVLACGGSTASASLGTGALCPRPRPHCLWGRTEVVPLVPSSSHLNAQRLGPGLHFCPGVRWYRRDSRPDRSTGQGRNPGFASRATEQPHRPMPTRFTVLAGRSAATVAGPGSLSLRRSVTNPCPLQGQVLLGAVGAFDWSGGVLLYDTHSRRGRFLNQTVEDARGAQYSYLGEGRAWGLPG